MAVRIRVDVEQVRAQLQAVGRSSAGAIAQGITKTAEALAKSAPQHARGKIDRPTDFTLKGFRFKAAEKTTMRSEVFLLPRQAGYLRFLEEGGRRTPMSPRKSLPISDQEDAFGNMPKEVRQLMRRQVRAASGKVVAQAAKRAQARAAQRAAREAAKLEARVDRRVASLLARNARRRRPGVLNPDALRLEVRSQLRAAAAQRAARLAARRKAQGGKAARPKSKAAEYFVGKRRGQKEGQGGAGLWKRTRTGLRLVVSFDTRATYKPSLGMVEHWQTEAQRVGPMMIQQVVADLIARGPRTTPRGRG